MHIILRIGHIPTVSLVKYSGAGLSGDDFKQSIATGTSKINYYTYMALEAKNRIASHCATAFERVLYHQIMMWTIDAIKDDLRNALRFFGNREKA